MTRRRSRAAGGRSRRSIVAALLGLLLVGALLGGCGGRDAGGASTAAVAITRPDVGFRSAERLDEHYRKHGREFGSISREEYLRLAQTLRDRPARRRGPAGRAAGRRDHPIRPGQRGVRRIRRRRRDPDVLRPERRGAILPAAGTTMTDDPIRRFLRARGVADHVVDGGLDGLVADWEHTAERVERGYAARPRRLPQRPRRPPDHRGGPQRDAGARRSAARPASGGRRAHAPRHRPRGPVRLG